MEEQITSLFGLGFVADDAADGANDTAAQIVTTPLTATRVNRRPNDRVSR
jgi:hypothetical protein